MKREHSSLTHMMLSSNRNEMNNVDEHLLTIENVDDTMTCQYWLLEHLRRLLLDHHVNDDETIDQLKHSLIDYDCSLLRDFVEFNRYRILFIDVRRTITTIKLSIGRITFRRANNHRR